MKWRTTVYPDLLRKALFQGSAFAALGIVILLMGGILIPLSLLKLLGLPLFLLSFFLIAIGLIPYRRLVKLQLEPNELLLEEETLVYFRSRKPSIYIPCSLIESLSYERRSFSYGIVFQLKTNGACRVRIVDPALEKQILSSGTLFLPYFSERSASEIMEMLKSPPELDHAF